MKAYVINLERNADRRRFISRQLKRHGIEYEIVPAVDAKLAYSSFESDLEALKGDSRKSYITPGMYACALSHRNIYRRMIEEGHDWALVLEDDAVIPHGLRASMEQLQALQPKNCVVLLSYYQHDNSPTCLFDRPTLELGTSRLMKPDVTQLASALAYVISAEAARSMLDVIPSVIATADSWNEFSRNGWDGEIWCLYPQLVFAAPFTSSIDYVATQPPSWLRRAARWVVRSNPLSRALHFSIRAQAEPYRSRYRVKIVSSR